MSIKFGLKRLISVRYVLHVRTSCGSTDNFFSSLFFFFSFPKESIVPTCSVTFAIPYSLNSTFSLSIITCDQIISGSILFRSYAVPSPRYLALTVRPFSPTAWTTCGSPGTRSIAWSLHLTSSPSTSRTTPLMGFFDESSTISPSTLIFKPASSTLGKWMNLNGSGLKFPGTKSMLAGTKETR